MMESAIILQFDDSPVKISRSRGDSISKLDGNWEVWTLTDKVKLDNSVDTLVSMKVPGHGFKPLKTWVKKLEQELGQENIGMDDSKFWLEMFLNWKDFPGLNPKLLVVSDFLDTLQMRLTSFYKDVAFNKVITERGASFSPFDGGLATMLYANFLWTKHKLTGPPESIEEQWLDYAMDYAERKYVWDLVSEGYILSKTTSLTKR